MIKITVAELLEAAPVLQSLNQARLPARGAYRATRLMSALGTELKTASESRNKLFLEYGQERRRCVSCGEIFAVDVETCPKCQAPKGPDEQSLVRDVKPERMEAFLAELKPLLETVIEIAAEPLPLSSIEALEWTPAEMRCLAPFLVE